MTEEAVILLAILLAPCVKCMCSACLYHGHAFTRESLMVASNTLAFS